ncbi:putative mitochondrial adenine nucleotide transporter BTL1-like [Hibiscus syriacus]|uniref:Mitochondrial adenine nucleotide transporter BTL1-like n=1 Tax=Hibiscus syriacus TaxID=106335 RepID=A0A6A3D497_HIBSY|nr:auxin-responsive protein SAUR72-like [Hibiscus syriacus]KAE8736276.1 putative mitochondrial adenine nucleotide transporter BTL1-like [Hibiscus syriacus]
MESKKSNKIRQIVRLQQILKKWKNVANAPKNTSSSTNSSTATTSGGGSRSIKFLKRTLSFSDVNSEGIPKGFLAVCVGKELKRFIIPTEYLGHEAFRILLRRAEEEFGFQQEGVLKIPCEVALFEKILDVVQHKDENSLLLVLHELADKEIMACCSPDCELTSSHCPQTCR